MWSCTDKGEERRLIIQTIQDTTHADERGKQADDKQERALDKGVNSFLRRAQGKKWL